MSENLPRVVELIRVSTDGQEKKATHEVQRAALDALRKSRPGALVKRVEALGVSGAKGVADRDDLQELMKLAQAKAFDELRVFSVDRLTRSDDARERAAIYGMLKDAGAKIVDCNGHIVDPADGDMGEIDYFLQTLFSARERSKIAQRTIAGKKLKASQGKMVHGIPPYGRRFDKTTGKWELVPEEVEIYHRIIDAYLGGKSLQEIKRALNAEGVPSVRGKWGITTIRRLLTKPTVIGEYVAFGHKMQIPPIITKDELASIKATMAQRVVRPKGGRVIEALIRGHGVCASCGLPLWVQTTAAHRGQARYGCPKPSRREISCPDRRTMRVKEVDEIVQKSLLDLVRQPKVFERALTDANAPTMDPKKALKAVEKVLAKLAAREGTTLKLYNDGFLSEDVAKTELGGIQAARKNALEKKTDLQAAAPLVPMEELHALRIELAAAMKAATPARMKELLAILRPAVTLGPDGIDIKGEIQVGYENRSHSSSVFVPHGIPFKLTVPMVVPRTAKHTYLTATQLEGIKRQCAAGMTQKAVGALYGLDQPVVSKIMSRLRGGSTARQRGKPTEWKRRSPDSSWRRRTARRRRLR